MICFVFLYNTTSILMKRFYQIMSEQLVKSIKNAFSMIIKHGNKRWGRYSAVLKYYLMFGFLNFVLQKCDSMLRLSLEQIQKIQMSISYIFSPSFHEHISGHLNVRFVCLIGLYIIVTLIGYTGVPLPHYQDTGF